MAALNRTKKETERFSIPSLRHLLPSGSNQRSAIVFFCLHFSLFEIFVPVILLMQRSIECLTLIFGRLKNDIPVELT